MPKHKHADLIIAWANGAEIQVKNDGNWTDIEPSWLKNKEYRIKPERVWPVTSLTDDELTSMINPHATPALNLRNIANAAIRRYIEDNEKAPIVVIKQPQPLAYP